jgi:hypothetical protein
MDSVNDEENLRRKEPDVEEDKFICVIHQYLAKY